MAIQVVTEFIAKTTVRVIAYVYNDAGALVDPETSIKVTIYDPTGEAEEEDEDMTMQDSTTGVYEYYFTTDADTTEGWWTGEVWVVDVDKTSSGTFGFRIK